MSGPCDIGARAIALGYATDWDVREAMRFQLRARILNGLDLGVGEALFWQGVVRPRDLDRLLRETDGPEDVARDVCGRLHFGEVAMLKGFVTETQLEECLEVQRREDACGVRHRLIGEIFLERGYMTRRTAEVVVDALVDRGLGPDAPDE